MITICPRSSDPFYIVIYYIKWVTSSWTNSTLIKWWWFRSPCIFYGWCSKEYFKGFLTKPVAQHTMRTCGVKQVIFFYRPYRQQSSNFSHFLSNLFMWLVCLSSSFLFGINFSIIDSLSLFLKLVCSLRETISYTGLLIRVQNIWTPGRW